MGGPNPPSMRSDLPILKCDTESSVNRTIGHVELFSGISAYINMVREKFHFPFLNLREC